MDLVATPPLQPRRWVEGLFDNETPVSALPLNQCDSTEVKSARPANLVKDQKLLKMLLDGDRLVFRISPFPLGISAADLTAVGELEHVAAPLVVAVIGDEIHRVVDAAPSWEFAPQYLLARVSLRPKCEAMEMRAAVRLEGIIRELLMIEVESAQNDRDAAHVERIIEAFSDPGHLADPSPDAPIG